MGGQSPTAQPKAPDVVSNPALQSQNLNKIQQQYMPSEYFGNQPIYDPTAILNAYAKNMPEFLKATNGVLDEPVTPPVAPSKSNPSILSPKSPLKPWNWF
jgi:hypothetical protein